SKRAQLRVVPARRDVREAVAAGEDVVVGDGSARDDEIEGAPIRVEVPYGRRRSVTEVEKRHPLAGMLLEKVPGRSVPGSVRAGVDIPVDSRPPVCTGCWRRYRGRAGRWTRARGGHDRSLRRTIAFGVVRLHGNGIARSADEA